MHFDVDFRRSILNISFVGEKLYMYTHIFDDVFLTKDFDFNT
jgi:hypothetical protein